jgi:hypothetical protein
MANVTHAPLGRGGLTGGLGGHELAGAGLQPRQRRVEARPVYSIRRTSLSRQRRVEARPAREPHVSLHVRGTRAAPRRAPAQGHASTRRRASSELRRRRWKRAVRAVAARRGTRYAFERLSSGTLSSDLGNAAPTWPRARQGSRSARARQGSRAAMTHRHTQSPWCAGLRGILRRWRAARTASYYYYYLTHRAAHSTGRAARTVCAAAPRRPAPTPPPPPPQPADPTQARPSTSVGRLTRPARDK